MTEASRLALADRLSGHANYLDEEGIQGSFAKDLADAAVALRGVDLPLSPGTPVAYLHTCGKFGHEAELSFEKAVNPDWTDIPLYAASIKSSDGAAKVGLSPVLASKEEQRQRQHGVMPVGSIAASSTDCDASPSEAPRSLAYRQALDIIDGFITIVESQLISDGHDLTATPTSILGRARKFRETYSNDDTAHIDWDELAEIRLGQKAAPSSRSLAYIDALEEIAEIGSRITDPKNAYGIQMANIARASLTATSPAEAPCHGPDDAFCMICNPPMPSVRPAQATPVQVRALEAALAFIDTALVADENPTLSKRMVVKMIRASLTQATGGEK